MRKSRFTESDAVREASGRRGVRERASPADPARLPHRGTVPDGVLPSPQVERRAGRRGDHRAQRDGGEAPALGLLEVLRPHADRGASVESQARPPRVLCPATEPSAAHQATPSDTAAAAARGSGRAQRDLVPRLHARCALRRPAFPHAERARRQQAWRSGSRSPPRSPANGPSGSWIS